MSPSLLTLLLHIGALSSSVKEVESLIADIIAKKPIADDAKALISSIIGMLGSVIPLPAGLTLDEATKILNDFAATL
jgi:hypothetical protein